MSPLHHAFASAISTISIPKTVKETLAHPGLRQAMIDEMNALESRSTWKLIPLPHGKSKVGCLWVFAIKVGPDGQVDCLKARLAEKDALEFMALTTVIPFLPLLKWPLFVFSCQWLL